MELKVLLVVEIVDTKRAAPLSGESILQPRDRYEVAFEALIS